MAALQPDTRKRGWNNLISPSYRRLVYALAGGLVLALAACDSQEDKTAKETDSFQGQTVTTDCRIFLPPTTVSENSLSPARLNVEFKDFRHEEMETGGYRHYHTRRLKEILGTGVNVYRGRVCIGPRSSESDNSGCVDSCTNYRIEGSDELVQPDHYFHTNGPDETILIEYWLRQDDAVTDRIAYRIEIDSENESVKAEEIDPLAGF